MRAGTGISSRFSTVGVTSISSTGLGDDARRDARDREDHRDVQLLVVQRRAVVAAAVLVELLAVVGGEDDDRARAHAAQVGEQAADGAVGVGDLAVVAIDVGRAERELGVRLVRLVRLEEVNPDERLRGLTVSK